jgi:hypothetical protein
MPQVPLIFCSQDKQSVIAAHKNILLLRWDSQDLRLAQA